MINDIFNDAKYQATIKKQIREIIEIVVENDIEFSVTANVQNIHFEPQLPEIIHSKLGTFALFTLAGYTFSTITIDDEKLSFEAGFGKENFGSVVSIPNESIFQIVVDESILYLNPLSTAQNIIAKKKDEDKSKNVFKNNPKNKALFT